MGHNHSRPLHFTHTPFKDQVSTLPWFEAITYHSSQEDSGPNRQNKIIIKSLQPFTLTPFRIWPSKATNRSNEAPLTKSFMATLQKNPNTVVHASHLEKHSSSLTSDKHVISLLTLGFLSDFLTIYQTPPLFLLYELIVVHQPHIH